MFTQFRERLHEKKSIQGVFPRSYQAINWQKKKLSSVAILTDANIYEDANFQKFFNKLQQQFEEVQVVGFQSNTDRVSQKDFLTFTKKEVDWMWRPKGAAIKKLKNTSFELLINLSQKKHLPLEYLAATCKAHYKIGAVTEYPNQYDLILKTEDFKSYLHQIHFFLSKFKKDSSVVLEF